MGATHLNAIDKVPGVSVGAICTTNERARSGDLTGVGGNLAVEGGMHDFTAVQKYADWRELVADPVLDAIDICLPTDLHAPVALAALQAGKHVLCEKPMALKAEHCTQMLQAADKVKKILMIGHVLRFWPEYESLYNFVKTERGNGHVQSARFVRSAGIPDWSHWLPVEERSGGAIIDLLIHDIDQALSLFGVPERVSAKSMGAVDTVSAVLFYGNGLKVEIQGGWLPAGEPFHMGFHVSAERARLDLEPSGLFRTDEAGRHQVQPPEGNAYESQIQYFIQCCTAGTQPDRCPPAQSAAALEIALRIKESRKKEGQTLKCLD